MNPLLRKILSIMGGVVAGVVTLVLEVRMLPEGTLEAWLMFAPIGLIGVVIGFWVAILAGLVATFALNGAIWFVEEAAGLHPQPRRAQRVPADSQD